MSSIGFDIALDTNLERAYATKPIMDTLAAAPYLWSWGGMSPNNYGDQRQAVEVQIVGLGLARAATGVAATQWDLDLDGLIAAASDGSRLARGRYKAQPVKFQLFEGLKYPTAGRTARYQQALDFEVAWQLAEPAWVFQTGLTLAAYRLRREAIVTGAQVAHAAADAAEGHERAKLHFMADELHRVSVDWYEEATVKFDADTVPGQLVRTIPTSYNPNRGPTQLKFTAHMSGAPNTIHLVWRAARGEHFFIKAKGPGAANFSTILNGVTDTEWVGLGMAPGAWEFEGYATNQYGQGEMSAVAPVLVAQLLAA